MNYDRCEDDGFIIRGKAISKLELMRCNPEWNIDLDKAVDLAIKVLRRTESEDCISRQALIDEILEDGNGAVLSYPTGMYEDDLVGRIEKQMIKHFIGVIGRAPTVESKRPKGEWVFSPKDAIDLMFTLPKCSKCGVESADAGFYCPTVVLI